MTTETRKKPIDGNRVQALARNLEKRSGSTNLSVVKGSQDGDLMREAAETLKDLRAQLKEARKNTRITQLSKVRGEKKQPKMPGLHTASCPWNEGKSCSCMRGIAINHSRILDCGCREINAVVVSSPGKLKTPCARHDRRLG